MAEESAGGEAFSVIRVKILCEGQTEEAFVNDVLSPHFAGLNIFPTAIVLKTSREGRGGVSRYEKIRTQVEKLCKEDSKAWVTTLLDFYALPKDFPSMESAVGASLHRAKVVTEAFQRDISQPNFIAHLVVHEFESLLFSAPDKFSDWFDQHVVQKLKKIRNEFDTPEHINDHKETAPSKRICLASQKKYEKVNHGILIALDIGLDVICRECPLFNSWVGKLESLPHIP